MLFICLSLSITEQCSKKPLIITEYGYDVYDDPCKIETESQVIHPSLCFMNSLHYQLGGRSNESPCYNSLTIHPQGFGENQRAQSEWVQMLFVYMC